MKNKHSKRILLLYIGLIALSVIVFVFVARTRLKSQPTPNDEAGCIKNKDQAVEVLLGTGKNSIASPILTYKKEVEARGNQVFFDEYSIDALADETRLVNHLDVGEILKNGSRLLHARFSYKTGQCDLVLSHEDIKLTDGEKKYQFSFVSDAGTNDQFVDETKTCQFKDPTTELADIDGDGRKEVVTSCFGGGTANVIFLFVYKLNGNKLDQIGFLSSESKYDVKDCNADRTPDLVTYIRDMTNSNGDNASMVNEVFCNSWDKTNNNFIETKIDE